MATLAIDQGQAMAHIDSHLDATSRFETDARSP
jgi:hypothetical protein